MWESCQWLELGGGFRRVLRFPPPMTTAGFDFPRGPGGYAPRFCCWPLDFSDKGPKIVGIITRNHVFDHLFFFSKRPFRAPSLKTKCQTLQLASHDLAAMWQQNDEIQNSKSYNENVFITCTVGQCTYFLWRTVQKQGYPHWLLIHIPAHPFGLSHIAVLVVHLKWG